MTTISQTDQLVSNIVRDSSTKDLLERHGLKANSVTWEDTGRYKGSCWGPNISDMTLVVKDGAKLMPVIRKPNFADVTDDVPIDTFRVRVGNEKEGGDSRMILLKEYLQNLDLYVDNSNKLNLHCPEKDDNVLTSSQCCVIPVEKNTTEFAVQLFNYQSYTDNPAVLVILATKDGTSTQIVQQSNQKLFFNDKGIARWFTAERLQDYRERKTGQKQEKVKSFTDMEHAEKMENVIMMIQIPLKVSPRYRSNVFVEDCGYELENCSDEEECTNFGGLTRGASGNDQFVPNIVTALRIGHNAGHNAGRGMDLGMVGLGSGEGNFIGTKGLKLERDTRFPMRCTFQYYRVTDQNSINESDVNDIQQQLSQVTSKAVQTGSLVTDRNTGRTTEPDLTISKPTDIPSCKLTERDYLDQSTASVVKCLKENRPEFVETPIHSDWNRKRDWSRSHPASSLVMGGKLGGNSGK